jgi:hypothetical protein
MKAGITSSERIKIMVEKWKNFNITEMEYSQDEVDRIFQRFLSKLSR